MNAAVVLQWPFSERAAAGLDLDLVGTRCSGSLAYVQEPVKEVVGGAKFIEG